MKSRITNLQQLKDAVDQKRAVHCPKCRGWDRPRPAAFMLHQPGAVLLGLFDVGMWVYEATPKRKTRLFNKSPRNK